MLQSKSHFYFILLLFIFHSCQETDEVPVKEETEINPIPVQPLDIDFPQALFTEPEKIREGESSTIIYDRIVEIVDATPKDASIYISIYAFTNYKPLIDALERASSRNVSLHIMFDMGNHNESLITNNSATIRDLTQRIKENIEIVAVQGDAGSIPINHNKFILISEVETMDGTAEEIVLQTSHNFTEADTYRIQDAVILSHESAYHAYLDYWKDMKVLANEGMINFEYREYNDPDAGITAFFYPKRKNGEFFGDDTIIELLDEISDPSNSTIRIGMSGWTNTRVNIVEKLGELLNQGATIEIITKSSIGPKVFEGLKELQRKGAFVKIYNMKDPDEQRINIHSKFMLIEGVWRGEDTNLILTGSRNFSINALRNNNEASLLFQDHLFFNIYKDYFEELKTLPGVCCPE